MPTTAINTVTITPDTDADTLTGRTVAFTIAGAGNKPLALNGRWETLRHMDLGNGVTGMGGTFDGEQGRTALFMPYGTVVIQ